MALARHCHRYELERFNQACWNGKDQLGLVRPQPLDVTARRSHTISENTHHEVQGSVGGFVKGRSKGSASGITCVHRKLMLGRNGDEVRPGWRMNRSHRFAERGEKHPHDMPPSRFPKSPTLGDSSRSSWDIAG